VTRRGLIAIVVAAVLVAAVVAAVLVRRHHADDPYAAYCATVDDHRGLIASATEKGATTGLISALPSFEALRDKAPSDIKDDWDTVIAAITDLVDTLHQVGVDPASYDRSHPPANLSKHDQGLIDAAAERLGSDTTRQALSAVDQEARDVCHSPLML